MAARTKLNEGTESADNKVTKLQGGLRHVRMAKAMGKYLNYRLIEMLCLLTHILASNAISVIDEYNRHENDKFILLKTHSGGLSINLPTADIVMLYNSD